MRALETQRIWGYQKKDMIFKLIGVLLHVINKRYALVSVYVSGVTMHDSAHVNCREAN